MVKPIFYGWNFVCPVCGCTALEDDHACLACGETVDWSEERAADADGYSGKACGTDRRHNSRHGEMTQ